MNKLAMIGFLLIAFIGISTAGGILESLTAVQDVIIDYPTDRVGTGYTQADMNLFNGLAYDVKGNNIILNKKGVYDNKVISFEVKQTCLDWIQPSNCSDFNSISGECRIWDNMLFTEIQCRTWTRYDTNYFINQAIKKELEGLKTTQLVRASRVTPKSDFNGKVIINTPTRIIVEEPLE